MVFEAVFLRVRSARLFLPLVLFVIVQFMIVGGWHAKFVDI